MDRNTYRALHLVPAVLLVLAVLPLPYGYYTLMRLVVCAASIWLAILAYQKADGVTPWVITFGVVGHLFNPLIPVHLTREIWFLLDLGAAAVFGYHLLSRPALHNHSD